MLFSMILLMWNLFYRTPPSQIPIPTPTLIPTVIPTTIPSITPTNTPRPTRIPTPRPTATPISTLLTAVNTFRKDNGKTMLTSNALLCTIAGKRSNELVARGSLDSHQGIQKYKAEILATFSQWWEVIYSSAPAKSTHAIVNQGWANSPTHKDSLLATEATHGCGSHQAGFAVFLVAKK